MRRGIVQLAVFLLLALSVIAVASVGVYAQKRAIGRPFSSSLVSPKPTSATSSISYSPQGPCPPIGDVNGDGVIKPDDAQDILSYTANIKPANFYPDRADVNKDGKIDSIDAALIKQYLAGIINTFAACPPVIGSPTPK